MKLAIPSLLSAVRTPLQFAAMTYVGAAGLAGAAIVTGVMVTPAREQVQQALAPAAELVQSVVPIAMPPIFDRPPLPLSAPMPQTVGTEPSISVSVDIGDGPQIGEPEAEADAEVVATLVPAPATVVVSLPTLEPT